MCAISKEVGFEHCFVVCFRNKNKHCIPMCLRLPQLQNGDALGWGKYSSALRANMRKHLLKFNIRDKRAKCNATSCNMSNISVTKAENVGTILLFISWFSNCLGEDWALIVGELFSQRSQQPRYFSSSVWRWKYAQVFTLRFGVMFICKPALLGISAPTRSPAPSSSSARAGTLQIIFFSYAPKGLRVVKFIIWTCATKMELREIKRALSKQKWWRGTKVGLERLVYFCKHAWELACSQKPKLARCLREYFPIHHLLKALELTKKQTPRITLYPGLHLVWCFFKASKDTKSKSTHCKQAVTVIF